MATLTTQWADFIDPAFRTAFFEAEKQIPTIYTTVFEVRSSDRNSEKITSGSGLSKLVKRTENQSITYEDEIQGYDVTYSHSNYSLGTSVSRIMQEDDLLGIVGRKANDLAKAKVRSMEKSASDVFNNGFTAGGGGDALFTSGDALALFSSSHTRSDGGTAQSNTTTADLAEDALEVAIVAMRATVDNKGQLISVRPTRLVVPPALEKEARILLNSTQRTGTANNDINPYSGALQLTVWDYLGSAAGGSDTAWFVLADQDHRLAWYNRSDHGLEGPFVDFDTKAAKWSVDCRWSVGFDDWRGTYGSKGDNS
jgi:hypothetical protein